ncbi:ECF-type sigma factor [uncultured Alteromonas sp.]|uniref:ECF-type sigma factor n=1 Tax=uncultured Alteromonas sp. TaxID=179113 RepID=UPI0030D0DEED|tara:strand:+ start:7283 stop:7852 length:570 start_codon:yes stop_codon:yes gene_type:complete
MMEIDKLLREWQLGDKASEAKLFTLCYETFKDIAHSVKVKHMQKKDEEYQKHIDTSYQTTMLVHDAYVRLANSRAINCDSRSYFFKAFSQVIYTILIDHVRKHLALKRVTPDALDIDANDERNRLEQLLDIKSILDELNQTCERQVSVFLLRYACSIPYDDIATMLEISKSSAEKDVLFVKQNLSLALA